MRRKIALIKALSITGILLFGCVRNEKMISSTKESESMEESHDIKKYENLPVLRLSSFNAKAKKGELCLLKMQTPYEGSYRFASSNIKNLKIYSSSGRLYREDVGPFVLSLKKDEIICLELMASQENKSFGMEVHSLDHPQLLPYDPIDVPDVKKFKTSSESSVSPLKPSPIKYVKRKGDYLYINCNNPEVLDNSDLNKALTRNDVSNKEVFFAFEHNNGKVTKAFHYGYQIRNTGDDDLYVTIKNLGFQLEGPGSWLGQKEWIDFYNTKFRVKNIDKWSPSQKKNFDALFGFQDLYESPNHQPITYRIPKGKHFYVMGGTSRDAYNEINVFKTADKKVKGGCSNGAVLFSVIGKAEAAFFAYDDPQKIQSDNKTHQGYVVKKEGDDSPYGAQYVGYDDCGGVVDNKATWIFNDSTSPQALPVSFENSYLDDVPETGIPYSPITSSSHTQELLYWHTHINPQSLHSAVGSDMTKYRTIDKNGKSIVIDSDHYDGRGHLANIGNWMIDYIDTFTFVNQGDKDRTIEIKMKNNGSLACLVRDQNGDIIKGTEKFSVRTAKSQYGDAIEDDFIYTRMIPSHSIVQFHVEYNLLANSYGSVLHTVNLK